jgi:chitodextrinase
MFRRFLLAAVAAAPLVVVSSAVSSGNPGFVVGFSEDRPKWIGAEAVEPAAELGAGAFRLTLQWAPGQTTLSASEAANLDRATAATKGMQVVLTVYGTSAESAPQDATRREEYCSYVRGVLGRYPAIRDVIVWNEPNKSLFWRPQLDTDGSSAAPAAYEALLAHCYDVLHAAFSNVNVIGLALSPTGNDNAGSHSPGAFIRGVGEAYRASGRTRPLLDAVAHHVYGVTAAERPWRKHIASKVLSEGDWNKLMYNLWLAFDGTAQPLPGSSGVGIWYMEGGSQTAIDPGKQAAYTGSENVAVIPDDAGGEPESPPPSETSPAPDQSTQVRDSIRLAACQPHVRAYFNFLLIDEARLEGWQSGAYWADDTPKDSMPTFRQAISEATTATVDCDALKGGRPSSDFMPPSAPRDLVATTPPGPARVDLSWSASNDDASPISYRVYRNGVHVATTAATTWTNTSVAAAATYTYAVRAIDDAGNLGDASTAVTVTTPAADTTAPETTITVGPSGTANETAASFEFGSSEGGSRFECALDGAPFAGCGSPTVYMGLAAGDHSFAVRAIDLAGNTDPTPAVRTWTVINASGVSPQPESPPPPLPLPPPALPPAPIEPVDGGAAAAVAVPAATAPQVATVPPMPRPATTQATWPTIRLGTAHSDVIHGTARRDILRGLAGNDVLYSFAGNDVLSGGPGRDRLLAGPGSDVVHADDGARDVISCGPGRDLAYADRADRVGRDCERVRGSRGT